MFPVWWDVMDLEDLGWGFPLYFYFNMYLGVIYLIMTVWISIVGSVLYARPDKAGDWEDGDAAFIAYVSIGNFGPDPEKYTSTPVDVMVLLNSLMILAIYILNMLFRPFQVRVIKKVDEINLTPGDFAVMVSNIPKNKSKEEIKNWIWSHQTAEICEINLCYDIKEAIDKLREVNKYKVILLNFDKFKHKYERNFLEDEIERLNKDIEKIKSKMNEDHADKSFTGKAFIIFQKQNDAEELVWKFKRTWMRKTLNFILFKVSYALSNLDFQS